MNKKQYDDSYNQIRHRTIRHRNTQEIRREYVHGLSIASGAEYAERESFEQIILTQRLHKAVTRLNPDIPTDAKEQAVQKVLLMYSQNMLHMNETHTFNRLLDTLLPKLICEVKGVV